jgi:hypothetical protein
MTKKNIVTVFPPSHEKSTTFVLNITRKRLTNRVYENICSVKGEENIGEENKEVSD